jgi:hypothetical protein
MPLVSRIGGPESPQAPHDNTNIQTHLRIVLTI